MSFFYWGVQNRTQNSRCGLIITEYKGTLTSSTCWLHFTNAVPDAVGRLCHKGTLLALGQPAFEQNVHPLFCEIFFQPVLLHGVIPTQMEYPVTLALVKLNEV